MAHIAVHRIEQIAARRLARLDQVQALAPFPARPPHDPWSFRRAGPAPLWPVAVGGRAGRMYLGEELPATEPDAPPTIRAPAAERSPNIGALPRGVPEQLCYALTVRGSILAPDVAGVSSPPLPWPAQIVGASLHWNHGGTVVSGAWGLWVTPVEWTNSNNTITGESLVQLVEDDIPLDTYNSQQNALTPIPLLPNVSGNDQNSRDAATGLIGGIIRAAGLRLTLVRSTNVDSSSEMVLVVTLRQIVETRPPEVFRERVAPPPRATTARSSATSRLPAQLKAPPIVPGGLIRRTQRITPIFGSVDEERVVWSGHVTGSGIDIGSTAANLPKFTILVPGGFPTTIIPGADIFATTRYFATAADAASERARLAALQRPL